MRYENTLLRNKVTGQRTTSERTARAQPVTSKYRWLYKVPTGDAGAYSPSNKQQTADLNVSKKHLDIR